MENQKKPIEKICNNCMLYNRNNGTCKVAVLIEGKEYHMPVDPGDSCHLEALNIEIKQVRWWVEDEKGNPTDGNGIVKMECPEDFYTVKKS
jgi:hypothetical protein